MESSIPCGSSHPPHPHSQAHSPSHLLFPPFSSSQNFKPAHSQPSLQGRMRLAWARVVHEQMELHVHFIIFKPSPSFFWVLFYNQGTGVTSWSLPPPSLYPRKAVPFAFSLCSLESLPQSRKIHRQCQQMLTESLVPFPHIYYIYGYICTYASLVD